MLADGKISIGEYIRAKWNNVVQPFSPDKEDGWINLFNLIAHFKMKSGRDTEFVAYRGNTEALRIVTETHQRHIDQCKK